MNGYCSKIAPLTYDFTRGMELEKQKKGWMSVPQFGGWDQKSQKTDYSMVFQRARANRKHNKAHFKASSLGNEEEFIAHAQEESPSRRKKMLSYLSCCSAA
uniref:1,4-alpha-glucan-branching enzyme n=1 Tax=Anthurium amnicola TaxID=1678845 RepID=A0A1D1YLP1_9ARAE